MSAAMGCSGGQSGGGTRVIVATCLPFLAETRSIGVIVRPDFYVFGGARDAAGFATLTAELARHLDRA